MNALLILPGDFDRKKKTALTCEKKKGAAMMKKVSTEERGQELSSWPCAWSFACWRAAAHRRRTPAWPRLPHWSPRRPKEAKQGRPWR